MSSPDLRLIVNVYPQGKYGGSKEAECILKMLVPRDILVASLVEQIVMQNDSTADYTKYGLMLSESSTWLIGSNTISYYDLMDGDVLDLYLKREKIKVRTLDGSVRTVLVDETLTVGSIVEGICAKLGIMNPEEYALVLEGMPEGQLVEEKKRKDNIYHIEDDTHWLRSGRLLREQGAFEAKSIILKRRFFFNHDTIDTTDPVELNLLYSQIQILIVTGRSPCTLQVAYIFAATQLQVEMGDYHPERFKNIDLQPSRLMPSDYAKSKDVKKLIISEYMKLAGMSQMEAKLRYVKLYRSLPTCGATFFTAEIMQQKKKFVPIFLGVSRIKIVILDVMTRKAVSEWSIHHMRRWSVLFNTITIDFGDYADTYLKLRCPESETVSDLISGYINIVLKRRQLRRYKRTDSKREDGHLVGKYYRPNYRKNVGANTTARSELDAHTASESENGSIGSFTDPVHNGDHVGGMMNHHKKIRDDERGSTAPELSEADFSDQISEIPIQGQMLTCSDKKLDNCIEHVANTVRVANNLFRRHELQLNKKFDQDEVSPTSADRSSGGLSPFGIVNVKDDRALQAGREMDKHIMISDVAATIAKLPDIVMKTGLHRFNPNLVDADLVANDINILLHSQVSFVRSFRSAVSSDSSSSDILKRRLMESADGFFSRVQMFTDKLRNLYIDKFSLSEYLALCTKLSEPTSTLLEDLGYDVPTLAQQKLVMIKNAQVIDLMEKLMLALNEAQTLLSTDYSLYSKLEDQIIRFKFAAGVHLAFIPAFCPVSNDFAIRKRLSNLLPSLRSNLADIVAFCEASDIPIATLDKVRECSDGFMNASFTLDQMMHSTSRYSLTDHLTQLNFVNEKLEMMLLQGASVNEFARQVNDLSLSSMNLFNNLKLFENSEDESDATAQKISSLNKRIGAAYSTVMLCARDYASNINDQSLRDELFKSVQGLRSVMDDAIDGGIRNCRLYNIYSKTKALLSSLNLLVSYSKTALIPKFSKNDHSRLNANILQFSGILSLIVSAIKSYALHPTRPASQVRIVEASNTLCECALPLITAAIELNVTCHDQNIRSLIQKSTSESLELHSELVTLLSDMENYPSKLKIQNSIEQLSNHLQDLSTAREKASMLVYIKGYDSEIALNDFLNSLRCARISNSQLMSDIHSKAISSASATLARVASVIQCISFATLGICSGLDDVSKRVDNIDFLISYAKVVHEVAQQMDKAVCDLSLCTTIFTEYSPRVKDALRNLSGICQSQRKLLEYYNISSKMENITPEVIALSLSDVPLKETANCVIGSIDKLILIVSELPDSLNVPTDNQSLTFDNLNEAYKGFLDSSLECVARMGKETNSEVMNYAKSFVEDVSGAFKHLIDALIDYSFGEVTHENEKSVVYYASCLDYALEKCIPVFTKCPEYAPKALIDVKNLTHPMENTITMMLENLSSNTLPPQTSPPDRLASHNSAVLAFTKVCDRSAKSIETIVESICQSHTLDPMFLKDSITKVSKDISGISEGLLNISKTVESVESNSGFNTFVKTVIEIEVIKDVMDDVENIVSRIDKLSGEDLLAAARNFVDNCTILHYSCRDASHQPEFAGSNKMTLVSYCKDIESCVGAISPYLQSRSDHSAAEEDAIRSQIHKASDLTKNICAFLCTPDICIINDKPKETVIESRRLFYDAESNLIQTTKKLLSSVEKYHSFRSPEYLQEIRTRSHDLIKVIRASQNIAINAAPGLNDYDNIRKILCDTSKLFQHRHMLKENENTVAGATELPSDDDVIDLTNSGVDYDRFGVLRTERIGSVKKMNDLTSNLAVSSYGAVDFINTLELVRLCEHLGECATTGEGDIIAIAKSLLELYELVGENLGSCCNVILESGEKVFDSAEIDAFMNSIVNLVDSCREMLVYTAWTEEKRQIFISKIDASLKTIKEGCSNILDSSFNKCLNIVNKDLIGEALGMISSFSPAYVTAHSKPRDRIHNNPKLEAHSKYARHIAEFKAFLDNFVSRVAQAEGKLLCKPVFVKPIIESLFEMFCQFEERIEPLLQYSASPTIDVYIKSTLRHIGFTLFRLVYTYEAWFDGNISSKHASDQFSEYLNELTKYLIQIYEGFKKTIMFMSVHNKLMISLNRVSERLINKINQAEAGALVPIDNNDDCTTFKDDVMSMSMNAVKKIREFADTFKSKTVEIRLSMAEELVTVVSDLVETTVRCSTALTSLNSASQVEILRKCQVFYDQFIDIIDNSASVHYTEHSIMDPTFDSFDRKVLAMFESIKSLVTCVKESGTEVGPESAKNVISLSKGNIEKSVNLLNSNSNEPCYHASGLYGALNASKELASIIPEFLKHMSRVKNTSTLYYVPVLNKFTSAIDELVKTASSTSGEINGEVYDKFINGTRSVCEKSLNLLDAVVRTLDNDAVSSDALQEATRDINMAITEVADSVQVQIKAKSVDKQDDPANAAEHELWLVHDAIKDACLSTKVTESIRDEQGSIIEPSGPFYNEISREIKNIISVSLDILRSVTQSYRIAAKSAQKIEKSHPSRPYFTASVDKGALVTAAKKFSFICINLLQLSSASALEEADIRDIIATSRMALISLNGISSLARSTVSSDLPACNQILDSVSSAKKSLNKLISIGDSNLSLNKAESLITSALSRSQDVSSVHNLLPNDSDAFSMAFESDVNVMSRVKEMDARLKVIKIEKELEEARAGLSRIRRDIYSKEPMTSQTVTH